MKNTLSDLNNHLFEQLERLNDEDLSEEQLDRELRRSEGMTKVAEQIIRNGELAYKTMYWTVFPEDPDIMPQDFESYSEAKEYADGLCCSYTIERAI